MNKFKLSDGVIGAIIGMFGGVVSSISSALITSNSTNNMEIVMRQESPYVIIQQTNTEATADINAVETTIQDNMNSTTDNFLIPNIFDNDENNFNIFSNLDEVQGIINDGIINLMIDKSLPSINDCIGYSKKTWGVTITKTESVEVNDKFLIIEIQINDDFSVKKTTLYIGELKENDERTQYKLSTNELTTTFDGERYLIMGDISNKYIDTTDMFLLSHFYYR